MSSVAQRLITAEEFGKLPNSEHLELVRGEVVKTMPPGKEHGAIAAAIATVLRLWAKEGVGGQVGVRSGFILARDPDTILGPDVCYISRARIQSDDVSSAFWTIAPDLAVEVISPSDKEVELRAKLHEYSAADTSLIWIVYPNTRQVVVHTADGWGRTYGEDDVIE